VLAAGEECTGSTFPAPNPAKTVSIVFEWCGLVGQRTLQGNEDSFFDDENVNFFVCNTDGRYGEGVASYTRATRKELSVDIIEGDFTSGGGCGFSHHYTVSVAFSGVGYKDGGGGNFFGWENPVVVEIYDVMISACYDGSEPDVLIDLSTATTDDTCGGTGCFDPCKFTEPEITVVIAP
jgi:hypothetical protein